MGVGVCVCVFLCINTVGADKSRRGQIPFFVLSYVSKICCDVPKNLVCRPLALFSMDSSSRRWPVT